MQPLRPAKTMGSTASVPKPGHERKPYWEPFSSSTTTRSSPIATPAHGIGSPPDLDPLAFHRSTRDAYLSSSSAPQLKWSKTRSERTIRSQRPPTVLLLDRLGGHGVA